MGLGRGKKTFQMIEGTIEIKRFVQNWINVKSNLGILDERVNKSYDRIVQKRLLHHTGGLDYF